MRSIRAMFVLGVMFSTASSLSAATIAGRWKGTLNQLVFYHSSNGSRASFEPCKQVEFEIRVDGEVFQLIGCIINDFTCHHPTVRNGFDVFWIGGWPGNDFINLRRSGPGEATSVTNNAKVRFVIDEAGTHLSMARSSTGDPRKMRFRLIEDGRLEIVVFSEESSQAPSMWFTSDPT
jgi:hypothetical protein